ncbi:MAG TPA: hypothetical protein VIV65_10710 [Gemmatimonadaceae bacterium]|jgi:hypothetical protein
MRARSILSVALLLPAALSAQVVSRRIGGESPARPKELPPQSGAVARDLYYRRTKLSLESYPMLSYVNAPGFAENISSWAAFGSGVRMLYAVKPTFLATLDMASSYLGGPQYLTIVEAGFRARTYNADRIINPFVDARIGYQVSAESYGTEVPGSFTAVPLTQVHSRLANGIGGVVGAGMDYSLSSRYELTTEALAIRTRMHQYSSYYFSSGSSFAPYTMTQYRFTIGLKYNIFRRYVGNEPGTM